MYVRSLYCQLLLLLLLTSYAAYVRCRWQINKVHGASSNFNTISSLPSILYIAILLAPVPFGLRDTLLAPRLFWLLSPLPWRINLAATDSPPLAGCLLSKEKLT